ncbi:guanyl-specific ribonuclease [Luteimonas sp. RIT-PG2_3]
MQRNKFVLLFAAIALVGAALWLQIPPSTTSRIDTGAGTQVAGATGPASNQASAPDQSALAPSPPPSRRSRDPGSPSSASTSPASAYPGFLPVQAHAVLQRIANGDAHPYRQDGSTFQNREGRLPRQPRGYYREYTVDTPGLGHRGARRIITGGQPPAIYYYTDDHYGSFRDFQLPQGWQDHE